MSKEVAKLIAAKFIARPDIKAVQRSSGEYNPVDSPFTMPDLLAHIEGQYTYGHYFLNKESKCKLFAFDIDLDKQDRDTAGNITRSPMVPLECDSDKVFGNFAPGNPRELWLDRSKTIQRAYFKLLLRSLGQRLASAVHRSLEIPTAVAYTGSKGVHVYGFTGLMDAKDVRDGAQIILDDLDCFEPLRGNHFFKHKDVSAGGELRYDLSFDGLTVEIFPKQVTLDGKTHGNLMRLPLGRNTKNPKDPTFFMDLRGNHSDEVFMRRDPVEALTTTDQWK